MSQTNSIKNIMRSISDYSGFIITISAMLALFIKPIRKWLASKFKKADSPELVAIKNLDKKVTTVETNFNNRIDELHDKFDIKIGLLDEKIDLNEKDRLGSEICRVADLCRNGKEISNGEYRSTHDKYRKYKELGGNHGIETEFDFICRYFNDKEWLSR